MASSFIPRQYLMEAFSGVCNLIFSGMDMFGDQTQRAKSKGGCIRELHSNLVRRYNWSLL